MPDSVIPGPPPAGGVSIQPSATSAELVADHVQRALDRRAQQFRYASDDEEETQGTS